MPVAQQCRPATHNLLLHGNCTISQKSKRSGKRTKNLLTDYLLPG
jgi:hypothetical protein